MIIPNDDVVPRKCEISVEMNLETIIAESRDVAQALLDFADRLTEIGEKYNGKRNEGGEDDG